jgi:hypothetical protein
VVCLAAVVAAGPLVAVSFLAKDVTVVVDGRATAVRSFAGTVREVLGEAGVSLNSGDVVRPPVQEQVSDGTRIEVRRARPLTLTLDGRTSEHLVTSTNVAGALAELDISQAAGRISQPQDRAVPLSGMSLTVYTRRKVHVVAGATRVSFRTTARTVREVLRQEQVDLPDGYRVTPPLGSFPADGTVIVITPPHPVQVQPEVMALDWQGLAGCESHGNPRAYRAEGPYYGMYQVTLSMWTAVGGVGLPTDWPVEEQTYRAQLLYQHMGGRWQSVWPRCGPHLF